MSRNSLILGFDIKMEMGSTWKPLKIHFWNQSKDFGILTPNTPFKYMGDALTALSLVKINPHVKSPLVNFNMNYSFAAEAWKSLEPHVTLFERAQDRVRSLQAQLPLVHPKTPVGFEAQFRDIIDMAMTPWGVDLTALAPLIEEIASLEKKMGSLILYNFNLQFSKSFMDQLHSLYSFLFHLRSIVAVDHNSQIEDASHEGVKMDSIYDYMPKAEYITNDALLYWNFKKLAAPFSNPKSPDPKVDKLFANPLEKAFHKYSHNACLLVDSLPASFLPSLSPIDQEEALHLVQMDWLLGSPAGVLFKIREELYGLQSGYEKIFWKDSQPTHHKKSYSMHVCCELTDDFIFGNRVA